MPARAARQQLIDRRLRQFAVAAGFLVACTGGYFLVAWLSGAMTWRGFHTITMKINASLCLLVCGFSLMLTAPPEAGLAQRRTARLLAFISLAIGTLTCIQQITGLDFGIDQILAKEPPGALGILHPNRMGPPEAVSFTLAGGALLLLFSDRPVCRRVAQWLAVAVSLVALLGMTGYLYGVQVLYGAARYTVIAWQTTLANFILGMGLLCSRPRDGMTASVTSPDPGGEAIRRLIPCALLLPILLGWLRLQGEHLALYDTAFGTSILILSFIIIFSALVYRTGQRLTRTSEAERNAIEERERAEESLRESVEKYRSLFEINPDAVLVTVPDGRIISANPAALVMFGMTDEEIQKAGRRRLVPPEDHRIDVMAEERNRTGICRGTITYLRKDGSTFEGDMVSVLVPAKDRALVIIRDITERARALEELARSEAKFRAVFEQAAVGIGRVRFSDARWIDVNATFCRMLGYTEDFMRATPWPRITYPEDVDIDLVPFKKMAKGELETYSVEKRFLHREGHHVWARLSLSLVRDRQGRPDYEIAVIEDISDRKRAEDDLRKAKEELEIRVQERTAELSRALQDLRVETADRLQAVEELRKKEQMLLQQSRLAAMGEMLVNISHQWRQPLNVIGLILQDLKRSHDRGRLSAEVLETSVARARELIDHMSQTIDDFRDYLKPERLMSAFDLREVVEKALSMMAETLKGVDVRLSKPKEAIMAEGYRNDLAQALMNILINARDAFRERKIRDPVITVAIFRKAGKSVVTIADNAGGIAPDIAGKIFEPYFTTKEPDKGTGIGLFMSKTIIEKNMRGNLTVRNTGEGAEFRIEI